MYTVFDIRFNRRMLEMGSSEVWTEAMRVMTGSPEMSAVPLVEYFQPLMEWLQEENKDDVVGWEDDICPNNFEVYTDGTDRISCISYMLLFFTFICSFLLY